MLDPGERHRWMGRNKSLDLPACDRDCLTSFMEHRNPVGQAFKALPVCRYTSMDATIVLRHERLTREVAAIIVDDERNVQPRDVIVQQKADDRPSTVNSLNSLYEVLRYPILFPNQKRGWGLDLLSSGAVSCMFSVSCRSKRALRSTGAKITQRKYYRLLVKYRMHLLPCSTRRAGTLSSDATFGSGNFDRMVASRDPRSYRSFSDRAPCEAPPPPPPILLGRLHVRPQAHFTHLGRLVHEYLVDMYSRMVDQRVLFWRSKSVQQQMASYREYDQDPSDRESGKSRVHMPANVMGSYRYARRNVHNGIALCAKYGKPDFFITLTTNPLWPGSLRDCLAFVGSHLRCLLLRRYSKTTLTPRNVDRQTRCSERRVQA